MQQTHDVVIIGTGAAGGMAAWNLSRQGMNVLMLLEHWAPKHVAYSQQRYGSEEAFARHNIARCRALGFNSLGFWTTPTVRAEARGQGMPYFLDLQLANSGPEGAWAPRDAQGEPMRAYWNGPNQLAHLVDPFHPDWRAHVAERCAALDPDDPYLLDVGEEVGTGLPAVEQRHLVAVLERELDDVPPQELRPSEDEDPHTLTLCRRSFATRLAAPRSSRNAAGLSRDCGCSWPRMIR